MNERSSRKDKIRVLHIISQLGMGGAETWLMELLRTWEGPDSPVSMDLLLTSGQRGRFDEEAKALGARLFYVPFGRTTLLSFYRRFSQILRQGQYHAVHDHAGLSSGWRLALPSRSMPSVRVTHFHNPLYQLYENYGTSPLRRLSIEVSKRLVSARTTCVVGTSCQLLEEYGFYQSRFRNLSKQVVHCGFSLSRFDGSPSSAAASLRRECGWADETPVVLFAGRLDRSLRFDHSQNRKNSAFAVEVFRKAREIIPDLKMIMAGKNDHVRSKFVAHLRELGLTECVKLLGIRDDIERLMLGSDLLLFPSRAEGLGMVAVEAQAAGLPVVASTAVPRECVVVPDLVCFMDLSDPVGSWAAKVGRFIQAPRPQPSTGDPRWSSTSFNIDVSAKRLEHIYRGVPAQSNVSVPNEAE